MKIVEIGAAFAGGLVFGVIVMLPYVKKEVDAVVKNMEREVNFWKTRVEKKTSE